MVKLTKTQKNFRKQMKEIKKLQDSPYDNLRDRNPFLRKHSNYVSTFILIFIITLIVLKYAGVIENYSASRMTNIMPRSIISQNLITSEPVISLREAEKLNMLYGFQQKIDFLWSEVSNYHSVPWEKRDINSYKDALINGITTFDRIQIELEKLENTSEFRQLFSNERELVISSGLSFKYFLNFLNTRNNSDLDVGNKYVKLVNEQRQARFVILKQLLDQKNYRYEITGDNTLRYYYKKY